MSTPPTLIGTQLGPYQIEAVLGSGGMATVYRGLDSNLQRPVAVKVLSAALAADPEYVRRFKREAQLIASLRHPNVAQVYAFGEQGGAPYMVQELLPGPTLEQRIAHLAAAGRLMPRLEALAVVGQLAAALDAAHAVGVIHRDVKPSNAIANARGELVLTDFGIARSAADSNLTQPGVVMGTPAYVAPEQAISSAALTPAADVYALGVLVYQLLTGRLPFTADTPTAVVLKHLYEQAAPPSQLRAALPPALDAVLLRALEKEPAARYQRAGELADAIAQAWPVPGAPAAPPAPVSEGPTRVWQAGTPTVRAAPGAAPPAAASTAAPAPTAAPQAPLAPAPRQASLLPWLGLALLAMFVVGGIAALTGGRGGAAETPAAAEAPATAAATDAPEPTAAPAPTEAPPAEPTAAPAPTEAPPAEPTAAPAPTEAPAAAPLDALGALIAAGLADGSAGDDAPEYLQRYGYLAEAIAADDDKRAEEEIRELSRKIAERAREDKLDQAFNEQAQALLLAVAQQYDLKPPTGR